MVGEWLVVGGTNMTRYIVVDANTEFRSIDYCVLGCCDHPGQ